MGKVAQLASRGGEEGEEGNDLEILVDTVEAPLASWYIHLLIFMDFC